MTGSIVWEWSRARGIEDMHGICDRSWVMQDVVISFSPTTATVSASSFFSDGSPTQREVRNVPRGAMSRAQLQSLGETMATAMSMQAWRESVRNRALSKPVASDNVAAYRRRLHAAEQLTRVPWALMSVLLIVRAEWRHLPASTGRLRRLARAAYRGVCLAMALSRDPPQRVIDDGVRKPEPPGP